jgi:hypothetical protein
MGLSDSRVRRVVCWDFGVSGGRRRRWAERKERGMRIVAKCWKILSQCLYSSVHSIKSYLHFLSLSIHLFTHIFSPPQSFFPYYSPLLIHIFPSPFLPVPISSHHIPTYLITTPPSSCNQNHLGGAAPPVLPGYLKFTRTSQQLKITRSGPCACVKQSSICAAYIAFSGRE